MGGTQSRKRDYTTEIKELTREEKAAIRHVPLGPNTIPIVVAIILVVGSLLLPHSGSEWAYDAFFRTHTAIVHDTQYIESAALWVAAIAVVVMIVVLITRHLGISLIGGGISLFGVILGMLAIGVRQARPEDGEGPAIGMYLTMLGLIVGAYGELVAAISKTDKQRKLESKRARATALEEGASETAQATIRPHAEIMQDDRRHQARERRERSRAAQRRIDSVDS